MCKILSILREVSMYRIKKRGHIWHLHVREKYPPANTITSGLPLISTKLSLWIIQSSNFLSRVFSLFLSLFLLSTPFSMTFCNPLKWFLLRLSLHLSPFSLSFSFSCFSFYFFSHFPFLSFSDSLSSEYRSSSYCKGNANCNLSSNNIHRLISHK